MRLCRRVLFFCVILCAAANAGYAQTTTKLKGKLVKAYYRGADTTKLYESLVTITQIEISGVRYITLDLAGVRPRNSVHYEFYNDNFEKTPIVWKRRMRNVVVKPVNIFITLTEEKDQSTLLINYDFRDSKGYGAVSYIIALEK
ncbi:hypothetical protein AGMMS50212_07260 [Spirochaetia bacterium]|nr:hypothetical protein AGMMS50212_07260 [Spirochaetia bacterium]